MSDEALGAVNSIWLRRSVGKEIVTSAGSLYRSEHFLVDLLDREGAQVSGGMREQREREQRMNEVFARLPRRESGAGWRLRKEELWEMFEIAGWYSPSEEDGEKVMVPTAYLRRPPVT